MATTTTNPVDPTLISPTTILAFKAAQEPLINLLRSHMEYGYAHDVHVPRVVVLAYLAGQDRNMELLEGV